MVSKKSQGLSFSTIVLAVISIFILVLVILFVSRGFTGLNRPVEQFTPTEEGNIINSCTVFCREAQSSAYSTVGEFQQTSRYCTRKFSKGTTQVTCYDKNGDGTDDDPFVSCTLSLNDGTMKSNTDCT